MGVRAYTFDLASTESNHEQIAPYSAEVDARVRRDLFNGYGNLIITGSQNGWMNDADFQIVDNVATVTIPETVTFIAGGRMFTMSETVELQLTRTENSPNIYTTSLSFDVLTKDNNGVYVRVVDYPNFDTNPEAWESEKFSVEYKLVVHTDAAPIGNKLYPSIIHNGKIAAGTTIAAHSNGADMLGRTPKWRGRMIAGTDEVFISAFNDVFTLSGTIKNIQKTGDGLLFGVHDIAPFGVDVNRGQITMFAPGWVGTGQLSTTSENGTKGQFDFEVSDIETITGNYDYVTGFSFFANAQAAWFAI